MDLPCDYVSRLTRNNDLLRWFRVQIDRTLLEINESLDFRHHYTITIYDRLTNLKLKENVIFFSYKFRVKYVFVEI